jgi:hypothetical protein
MPPACRYVRALLNCCCQGVKRSGSNAKCRHAKSYPRRSQKNASVTDVALGKVAVAARSYDLIFAFDICRFSDLKTPTVVEDQHSNEKG